MLLRRKDVSESHWLFIDTYRDQKSSTAAHEISGGSSVQTSAEWDPWHPPFSKPAPPSPNTPQPHPLYTPPHKNHSPLPMDNMHRNLWFYYVQQPCLDYVLFLGFFEVISFSLSDICSCLTVSVRWPRGWDVWRPHSLPRVDANLYSFLFSCYF